MRKKDIKYKVAIDTVINLIGTFIPVAVIQLFVYPQVAKTVSADEYGLLQSMISLVYLLGATFGDALCSTRLILQQKYVQSKIEGDFNRLNGFNVVILGIVTPIIVTFIYGIDDVVEVVLFTLILLLSYICSYAVVRYRLKIDYTQIFLNHCIGALGYFVGYFLFCLTKRWEFIFFTYFVFRMIHYLYKSELIKESFSRTSLFRDTWNSFLGISISAFLGKALNYFDKMILYPILGGEMVSVYYTANILGKLVVQIISPFTNVILTYLSSKKGISKKTWNICLIYGGIFSFISYFLCIFVSRPLILILYPQWAEQALAYVPVTAASLCISSYAGFLYPFTLKIMDSRFQILISASGLVSYILLVFILYKENGLSGCCWAMVISNMIRLMLMVFLTLRIYRTKRSLHGQ